jgi:hypothetical protein
MRNLVMVGVAGLLLSGVGQSVSGSRRDAPRLWPLEGELKINPKYLYRYYLVYGDGQKCALYGLDHRREPDQLVSLQSGARIRVRGTLGTFHHPGGSQENPSPFPPAWVLYMDVHEVENIK